MNLHVAHQLPFADLVDGLRRAKEQRLVYERPGPDGLVLYVYSEKCVYDGAWDQITMAARGLIIDTDARRIAATPFPKFFNVGERGQPIPDAPFETIEKIDGSLIIIFHHRGRWRTATKGALGSSQAAWAQARLDAANHAGLAPGVTYLAEAVYPENRIVIRYEQPELVMLGAYDETGGELSYPDVEAAGAALGWRIARRHTFTSVSDLVAHAQTLPRTEEGFVLRFEDGLRLKVKGHEYKRIHALISRVTPLAMWEAMLAGDDMQAIRRDLPEEFWADFDAIVALLAKSLDSIVEQASLAADAVKHLSDKEVGLRLATLDDAVRGFVFPWRKSGGNLLHSPRNRQAVFRSIRPSGNVLPGYVASYAISRVMEEAS